ncbi:MAG: energy-coupling factor ABC transporter ATP-binding protein [Lachnospiraceae bacterium]|jgi:energy-coupling factor transport system ATP-binding protein|nr:energy-coupling factor ABC transporter ATP-binding protein [Lachnospiraceae bacterium]
MIDINNFTFCYADDNKNALSEINLHVPEGSFIGLSGAQGSGKTSLLNALNGMIPRHIEGDYYGRVAIEGKDVLDMPPEELFLKVGTVLQDIESQLIAAVVEDEILFGLENFGIDKSEIEGRIVEALKETGIEDLRYRRIRDLSGGQKRKVAIASIIALRPKILLLDEPTGELDPRSSEFIMQTLKELNRKFSMTIIVTEKKLALLCEYVSEIAILDKGNLTYFGKPKELLASEILSEEIGLRIPKAAVLAKKLKEHGSYQGEIPVSLDDSLVMLGRIKEKEFERKNTIEILKRMERNCKKADENLSSRRGAPSVTANIAAHTVLELTNIGFSFPNLPIAGNVSFEINEGEFVVLLGENGAGKSTLLRLCNGLLKPTSGRVQAFGMDTTKTKTSTLAQDIGFLFQNPDRQLCQKTVKEEITFGLTLKGIKDEVRVEQIIREFGLNGEKDPFTLSRSERQLVALASILVCEPKLLLLDEPTVGLDDKTAKNIMETIQKLREQGLSVLMITHDMELVYEYADRALVLTDGEIVYDGGIEALMTNKEIMERASLLPAQIPALKAVLEGE